MTDTTAQDDAGREGGASPPTNRRGLSTLVWVLPAATFLVGLLIGFAVWGSGDGNGDQDAATPSVTASPTGDGGGRTVTVAVPQSCLDAIDESEQSLDLLEDAAQAISELDAGRLQEIVDELQGASERIRSLGDECRETTDVTVGPSPTS